jgi:RHS repeat-associated protein
VMTGIYVNNSAHNIIRDAITASTVRFENVSTAATEGYTLNLSFPTAYQELLTIMHYDSYNNLPSWKSSYVFVSENGNTSYNNFTTGLVVASQTKQIGTTTWLKTVTYYDEEYRPIQVSGDNIKAGKDRITTQVMFDGKPVEQWQSHTSSFYATAIVIKKKFTYDHADRVLTVKHQINTQAEVTIATNVYNELGQLLNKKLHITAAQPTALQTLDYGYNIRGWLTNVNRVENTAGVTTYDANDLFAFELSYNTTTLTGATAQYNGNISEQKWKGPYAEIAAGYTYAYDKLNRLLSSVSSDKASGSWVVNNKFDEKNITYDRNGNIKTLARYENGIAIDNLTYGTYTGNQLIKVDDAGDATLGFKNPVNTATEYYYDQNGSMYKDDNKGISNIVYNYLNLPATITVTGKGTINYLYDATGNKLRKISYDQATTKSDTTWYAGAMVYAKDTLQLMNYDEGRIRPVKINANAAASAANFNYVYDYFLRDHLNNTRMVITTESKTIIYAASMEAAAAAVEDQLFSNVSTTSVTKPAGFDAVGTNLKVSKLNGDINTVGNKRTGPTIILKVMAGDTISVSSQAWYSGAVQPAATGVPAIASELINLLTSGILNMGGGKAGINTTAYINGLSTTAVNTLISNQGYVSTKPKAFLNWMVLDEQFALTNTATYRGAVQVPVINAGVTKQPLTGPVNMVVQKSGYLYVYVSNESNMNVYFDDVVVNHKSGPVLEVTNFRAFGTEIATLGEKAYGKTANAYRYNGKELQSKEFSDGSGIDEYDYGARMYNPQIGRWHNIDPLAENSRRFSPYVYAFNNPLRFTDPDGMEGEDVVKNDEEMVKVKVSVNTKTGEVITEQVSEEEYNEKTNGGTENLAPMGINGGFSVTNNSKQGVVISGSAFVGGKETKTTSMLLQPGQMILGKRIDTKDSKGNATWDYDGDVYDMATGKVVCSNVGIYDVDAIDIIQNQTFEDDQGNTYTDANTNDYPGLAGEIKIQAGWGPALDSKIKGAPTTGEQTGNVTVSSLQNGNLSLTPSGGGFLNQHTPKIKYGLKVK